MQGIVGILLAKQNQWQAVETDRPQISG